MCCQKVRKLSKKRPRFGCQFLVAKLRWNFEGPMSGVPLSGAQTRTKKSAQNRERVQNRVMSSAPNSGPPRGPLMGPVFRGEKENEGQKTDLKQGLQNCKKSAVRWNLFLVEDSDPVLGLQKKRCTTGLQNSNGVSRPCGGPFFGSTWPAPSFHVSCLGRYVLCGRPTVLFTAVLRRCCKHRTQSERQDFVRF
jgi:hypothetical protein